MPTIRILFVSLLLLPFFPSVSFGQGNDLSSIEVMGSQGVIESAFMIRPEGRYKQVKGTPYLSEDWTQGKVWLDEDSLPGAFLMRYNVYGNEMQFVYAADTFAVANPLAVNRIELDKRVFEYLEFMHNQNNSLAYFEVLVEGDYRLLARHEVRLDAGREPMTPYHPQNEHDRFVHLVTYYLQTPESPNPELVPDRKKDWIKLAGIEGDMVKSFMKEQRIRLHRADDLVRLVEKINTL